MEIHDQPHEEVVEEPALLLTKEEIGRRASTGLIIGMIPPVALAVGQVLVYMGLEISGIEVRGMSADALMKEYAAQFNTVLIHTSEVCATIMAASTIRAIVDKLRLDKQVTLAEAKLDER